MDRKDLDRQTRIEFNKFQEGCVEENTNTESLVKRLTSDDYMTKLIALLILNHHITMTIVSVIKKKKKR